MPGPTETNFFHRADMDDTKVGASEKDDPALDARQGFEAMRKDKEKVREDEGAGRRVEGHAGQGQGRDASAQAGPGSDQ